MRTSRWLVALAAVFGAGLWLGRVQGPGPGDAGVAAAAPSSRPVVSPSAANALPGFDDPSLAELCATVTLTAEQQQMIGVRTDTVQRTAGARTLRLFGRVAPDESRVHVLNAGAEGFIREVAPVATGAAVRKGQWLATFSSPEARSPIQSYLITLDTLERTQRGNGDAPPPAQLTAARSSMQLAYDRLLSIGISPAQIEEIERSRLDLPSHLRIAAPADGIVLARHVSPGQKFSRGSEWYRIADLSRVWVVADVFEGDAHALTPGSPARVTVPGTDQTLPATVSQLLPQFEAGSRTMKVRLEVANPRLVLRPDMPVDLTVQVQVADTLAVPTDALVDAGLRKMVFVERAPGTFEPRRVRTGRRLDGRVEIIEGLMPGERVVIAGTFLIDSESRLRAGAEGQGAHAGHGMAAPSARDPSATGASGRTVASPSTHAHTHDTAAPSHTAHERASTAPTSRDPR